MKKINSTASPDYTKRMIDQTGVWWKRLLNVQAIYRWNIRRLAHGLTLDIGCGLGRNLLHLDGKGVGIDHNPESVRIARSRGLEAFTPEDFEKSPYCVRDRFDCLVLSHVAEHLDEATLLGVFTKYLPLIKSGGSVIIITPQEVGFRSDSTHVRFVDLAVLGQLGKTLGLTPLRAFSYPFPRFVGKIFKYNEFVYVARK